ncbi:MAG: SprT family zinc-dependent metalloprotease [Clostridia bacterium]
MQELQIENKISKRSNSIKIEVKKSGTVIVTRPSYVTEQAALDFLSTKKDWVMKSYEKVQKMKEEKCTWENGSKIYYLGVEYTLNINISVALNTLKQSENFKYKKTTKSIVVLDIANNIIDITIKEKYNTNENIRMEVLNFLIDESYANIESRLKVYSEKMNLKYNVFRIKDTKTRWGSCSSNKNLNFNYKLIFMPQWVIDYIVVHELSHLKHMDHSKNFWNLVSLYAPKYKEAKKWILSNKKIFEV